MGFFSGVAKAVAPAIVGGAFSAFGAKRQNEEARAAAERAMEFSETSYKNRYQWQKADLLAAGINPMLAYQSGAPSALSGTGYQPQNVFAGAGEAASTAVQATRVNQEVKRMDAEIDKIAQDEKTSAAQEKNIEEDTFLKRAGIAREVSTTMLNNDLGKRAQIEAAISKENYHSAAAAAAAAKEDKKFFESKPGKALRWIDRAGRALNPFASAGSSAKSATR